MVHFNSISLQSTDSLPLPNSSHLWTVFSLDNCPFSSNAVELLLSRNHSKSSQITNNNQIITIYKLADKNNQISADFLDLLDIDRNKITFPIIFHRGVYIGGFSDLQYFLQNPF